jgi:hypothetical protein
MVMTVRKHIEFQKSLAREYGVPVTLSAPPGTDELPLAERLKVYIEVFESGCSCTQPPFHGGPETCSECARAFVEAVKHAVGYEPTSAPAC